MAKEKETRTRTWTFVLYPESAPDHWRDMLDLMHIEWIESPLHDKDLNADGEPKKPHIHVLLMFGGVKSFDQVREITEAINCPIPQKVHNAKALVRYMAHLDNPEKAQYNTCEIIGHGGADVAEMLRPTSSQKYTIIAEMQDFVDDNGIREFATLVHYSRLKRRDDWFPVLCDSNAILMTNYIKSRKFANEDDLHFYDKDTGEMLF